MTAIINAVSDRQGDPVSPSAKLTGFVANEIEIPWASCVIAVRKDGASARSFLARNLPGADILELARYRIQLSDDPRSTEAKKGGFPLFMRDVMERLVSGRSVAIDAQGIRDDQIREFQRMTSKAYAPGIRLDLDGDCEETTLHMLPSPTDRRDDAGPFDIVGDVHGCLEELRELLADLGYDVAEYRDADHQRRFTVTHLGGRRIAFVGDLADRGPDSVGCLALAMDAVASGVAVWTIGNHDGKLLDWLRNRKVSMNHGFPTTTSEVSAEPESFRTRLLDTLRTLPSHLLLDGGNLVVAHAGCLEEMHGRDSSYLTSFCMFGPVTGQTDVHGYPVRGDWTSDYRGRALVVQGHTPVTDPTWGPNGNVLCIDTGCCFGGALTAMRWPERELVSVPAVDAHAVHHEFQPQATRLQGP